MRKLALIFAALVLALIALGSPMATYAAGASCWADSYQLAQGENTGVYCTGFSPLTYVNVYVVEPDGTAAYYADVKSNASGEVTFAWGNGVKNVYSLLLGKYTIVVQQLGLADQVMYSDQVEIENVGDGDHVAGAYLSASQEVYDITADSVTLHGWGFMPGEVVTLWIQKPALCSSYTSHYVDGNNGATFENIPNLEIEGTYQVDDIKADSAGAFTTVRNFGSGACLGTWRYAARGNTSGWGAYTDIALTGPAVSTNAWITTNKDMVGAFNDTIQFWAAGFGANETLNCWTTSPDGRAIAFGLPSSFDEIKMGPDGSGIFSLTTGSYIISPDDLFYFGDSVTPVLSEGSLGVWKMTCRGLASNTTAIAEYTVYGYETAP
ncbi:MAG: hypothetical protein HDKAJFGB_02880 [Anaerolineae bacterium]|nr:hypothetical protein [Anaerolineae bacterium]